MENTNHTLINLFKLSSFRIPQYQRAYAWEVDRHLKTFLTDLRQQVEAQKENPGKSYFLGTLLLHEKGNAIVDVVDGQQRLTTSVIFIAAAMKRYQSASIFTAELVKPKELGNYFLYDTIKDRQQFRTIEEDNPFFRQYILGLEDLAVSHESPSARRLQAALDYFTTDIADEEWENLVHVLINSKVMVYSVQNSADATLIFELQNDRGKKLTDLESLKSFLMHLIYLNTSNPEEGLLSIQTHFANIYRSIERQSANKRIPREDAILAYHCVAYMEWSDEGWRQPKELIKKLVNQVPKENVRKWVLEFVAGLQETFKIFTDLISGLDDLPEFAQLFVLERMASFWPLIIKIYQYDRSPEKSDFLLACRLMEVYALRGYGIGNLRSDAGQSSIYREAKLFKGNFKVLHAFLFGMCSWYDLEDRFRSGLDRQGLYKSNRPDVQYLLWRYENHLRSQRGKSANRISWRNYLHPEDDATRLSIEHIAAQSNPIAKTVVEWELGNPKIFEEVALHRLGNLVLDSKSANSSKGKYDFSDKLDSLSSESTFLSQGELLQWASNQTDGVVEWTVESIRERHEHLKQYAIRTWSPETYFTPPTAEDIPAEPEEQRDVTLELEVSVQS